MTRSRDKLSKTIRNSFLSVINCCFEIYKVDLVELRFGGGWTEYRQLRPVGKNCNCWGGIPEDEERYHEVHIKNCLTYVDEMQIFCKDITDLIKKKGKQLREKKLQSIEIVKLKDKTKTCFDYTKHEKPILDCTNRKQLTEKEQEIIQEIEKLSAQAQVDESQRKKQEEDNEKLRKEEEEKQQKFQKNFEEEEKKTKEKLKEEKQNSNTPLKNNESSEKLNNLKNKFHELYQKDKKYKLIEVRTLLDILDEIGKQTILDKNFLDAKTELQIIWDKLTPYFSTIDYCRYLIEEEEERNSEDKEKELNEYRLEECKKALEELGKIVYLSPWHENFLKKINDKLMSLGLEREINQLKNNKTENPQQQEENKKKIAEKEKELEQIKKNTKSEGSKQFQISPQVLSEFSSLSDNFNTKERIESLINPVKDNPEFLLEVQTKYHVEDLNDLLTDKLPEDIITIIKRFEYDNLSSEDKENKNKKIKAYYQQLNELAKDGRLTEKQISDYLYWEATEKLKSKLNSVNNQTTLKKGNDTNLVKNFVLLILVMAAFSLVIVLIAFVSRYLFHRTKKKEKKNIGTDYNSPKNILEDEFLEFNDLNEEWIKQSIEHNKRYISRKRIIVTFRLLYQQIFIEEKLKTLLNEYE